jgi:hypothetical protein
VQYYGPAISYGYTPQTSLEPKNSVSSTALQAYRTRFSNSTTSSYLCVSEWISSWERIIEDKMKSDVEWNYNFGRMDSEEFSSWKSSKYPGPQLKEATITTVSTVTTSLSSLCDRFPRAQSTGEITLTYRQNTTYTSEPPFEEWSARFDQHSKVSSPSTGLQ